MKKRSNLTAVRIDAREVRPLVCIAEMARKREILHIIPAAMLTRNNMLNMKSQSCATPFLHPAVLAGVVCPLAHKLARRGIHSGRSVDLKIVLGLRLKNAEKMVCPNQRIILRALLRRQRSLIAFLRQFIHPRLHAWIRRQIENGECAFSIQTSFDRSQRFREYFDDRRHRGKMG